MENNNRFSLSLALERKNRWQRIIHRYRFNNDELEVLYQRYIYKTRLSSLLALLVLFILLTATLGILNFVFVSHLTVKNVYYMAQCGISVLLLVYVNTRFMQQTHLLPVTCIVWVLCLSFAIVALPVNFGDRPYVNYTPAAGVWQITLIIFLVYSLMPLKIYVAVITGILLPVTHTLIVIFFADQPYQQLWRELVANVIIFLAVNITGIYVHDRCEHAQRKAFIDTRNCIAARLEMEDENEKLERLLISVFPQHVAMEMKSEILTPHENLFHNVHVQKYDSVSLLFADLVGFTSISAQCTAQELVKILNELFGKFDELAQDNDCLRVRVCGDNYFSVCGLPEARADNAVSCVQMALDMVNLINELREVTEVDLSLRVGVHTGSVVCGVIGTKKWQYDVYSDDVITANHVEATGVPGRVHISQTTLEHLHGAFDVEPAHVHENDPYLKSKNMDTFFVINNKHRKSSSLLRNKSNSTKAHSLKNIASPVVRLMSSLRFAAEIPFTQVYHTLQDDRNQIKPGDKTRKSLKKRSASSLQRCEAERVNTQLSHAIATRSLRHDKRQQVNLLTLRFKKSHHERMYQRREDSSFSTSMLCSLITLVCAATLQAIVLPRTLLLLVLFLVTFAWVCALLMMVLGNKMQCVRCSIQRSASLRLCIMLITILLIHAMAQVNVFCCKGGKIFDSKSLELGSNPVISLYSDHHLVCKMPEYIFLAGVLGYLVIVVFLKLAALVKLLLMLLMLAGYLVVMEFTHAALFTGFDALSRPDIPSHVKGIVAMTAFLLTLYIHSRHQEWTYRLDYLWKNQATEEKMEITEMQNNNRHVLCSLLPAHVAAHFIDMHHRTHMDLYSQAYFRVGILFASIANFPKFFSEMSHEGKANDCLRLLHRLVADFDELLLEDRFRYIDKIKTSGTTYMAVVGLRPDKIIQDTEESVTTHISTLLEFYFALRSKVQTFNETHGFSFSLRAGAHMGPAVAGVIGAKRPQYDIFGCTVNIASAMENTSRPDFLQVTEDIYRPMYQRYDFQSRGMMMLKHRGQTNTFYVIGRKAPCSSQVSMPNMSTIQWREAGVQLRNPSKRSSFHEALVIANRRSRPASFHTSKENLQQASANSTPASAKNNSSLMDSPRLLQNSTATPPGSLDKFRISLNNSNQNTPKELQNRKNPLAQRGSSSELQSLLPQTEAPLHARVGSPELPLFHYRNTYMHQGSGSLRQNGDNGGTGTPNTCTLTQSQILHARCESRCQSRASLSNGNSPKESTEPTSTPDNAISSRYSGAQSSSAGSSFPTSPSSPDNNYPGRIDNGFSSKADEPYKYEPPPGVIDRNKLINPPYNVEQLRYKHIPYTNSGRRQRPLHSIPDNISEDSDTKQSLTNSEIAEFNCILKPVVTEKYQNELDSKYPFKGYDPRMPVHALPYSVSNSPQRLSQENRKTDSPGTRNSRPRTLSGNSPHVNRQPRTSPDAHRYRQDSRSSSLSSEPPSPLISSSSCQCSPSSPMYSPPERKAGSLPPGVQPPKHPFPQPASVPNFSPFFNKRLQRPFIQRQYSLPETHQHYENIPSRNHLGTIPITNGVAEERLKPKERKHNKPFERSGSGANMEDKAVGTEDHRHKKSNFSPPPLPSPPPDEMLEVDDDRNKNGSPLVGPLNVTSVPFQQAVVFPNHAKNKPALQASNNSAFSPVAKPEAGASGTPEPQPVLDATASESASQSPALNSSGARPKVPGRHVSEDPDSLNRPSSQRTHTESESNSIGSREMSPNVTKRPPPAPPFQVKRRQKVQAPPRLSRSLDYIPSDIDDNLSMASRPDSPDLKDDIPELGPENFAPITALVRQLADNISLSSMGSSEMSRSDPALNYDSASTAYESEYDNYRPGMASDEDYFIPEPISDVDLDMFDDINIDNVTISDTYSLDMPMSLLHSQQQVGLRPIHPPSQPPHPAPRRQPPKDTKNPDKKITDV